MLIQDLINQGEEFENAYVVLERIEGQIRNKLEESNGFQLALMIYSLVVEWKSLVDLTTCSNPFEFLEHRFNMSISTSRKYYTFANILRNYRYLFSDMDHKQIKSVHMLDYFKRALENHPEKIVKRALTTMTVREFEQFSKRRPLYAPIEEVKATSNIERPKSSRTSVFFDYSRYQDILTNAFKNGDVILAVGADSFDSWDRITSTLIQEGYELRIYEAGTPYESAIITRKKPLLPNNT